jgi:tetratricopeptide (TPR) repeat protein
MTYLFRNIRICVLSIIGLCTINDALAQKSNSNKFTFDSLRAENVINQIDTFYYSENYQSTLDLIDKSFPLFDSLNIQSFKNHILTRRASIYRSNGDYGKALNDFYIVLENHRNAGNIKGEASILNHIGAVYRLRGDYPSALEYYFKALGLYQSINDKSGISHQLNNIGVVHLYQKLYDKALGYYQQSLKIEEELGNDEGIGISYLNIAEVYRKKGSLDMAIDFNLKALVYVNKTGDIDGTGTIYNEIAGINIEKGQVNDVLNYLDKAKESFVKLGSKFRLSECEMNYGNFYLITPTIILKH